MASKRDPQKQAELDAARERILKERQQREERVSDVVPVAHDAPSYDIFEDAPTPPERSARAEHAERMFGSANQVTELVEQRIEAMQRLQFIDRTAIGLYVSGYPQTKIYDHAARLWELRAQWRKGQGL